MKKRVFSILTALCLCLTLLPTAAMAADGVAAGSGTKDDPYQISTAVGLKWFRDVVNGDNGQTKNLGACAVLTADITLDSNEEWTPIGYANEYDKTKAYSGTFDGNGHTISGLTANAVVSGLFGYTNNAAIKNLTVAGSVGGGNCSTAGGGIVGYADGGTIENCGNLCEVTVRGSNPGGGIIGFASGLTITGCYNAGKVLKSDGMSGGGIVGKGKNVNIYDCYNVGEIGSYRGKRGGIVGEISGSVVYNCYNAGNVIIDAANPDDGTVHGIVGNGDGTVQIQNCYYLEDTKADTEATAMSAAEFADGTVLALLKNGERLDENNNPLPDPWANTCQYVAAAGKTLPVFRGQGDAHIHQSDTWETSETEHWKVCTCGAVFSKAVHQGGTATCDIRALCTACGHRYGELGAHSFTEEVVMSKYLKSAASCTEKAVYYKSCTFCGQSSAGTAEEATFETSALDHDWGEWMQNSDGKTHTRVCNRNASHTETKNCSGGTATCTQKATCAACGAEYGDTDPDNHGDKLTHVAAKAATTNEEGNIEYWYCEACHRYFSDAGVQKEIAQADTVIPKRQSSGGSSSSSYPVTAPAKTENGSVTVSPKNASRGSTVTITVTPDSGYVLETISVTDKNGNDLKLTDKGNGKYTFTMPGSKVEVKVTFMEDNSVLNFFYDVPNDAYYYEAVKWAAENGITGGIGNSLFAPNQPCTRAQIVTFLWRAAGSPVVNYLMPFTDVDESAYYAEAVRWAASTGIVAGLTETTFGTNDVCTRAQAATMIYRYAQAQGKGFTGAWMFLLPFTDVPEWAYESVAWCYMNGVTTGVSETAFAPGNDCTRAQIVTFLWRAFSK